MKPFSALPLRILLASACALAIGAAAVPAAERPNIVFILADDLGFGDLGCFGQEKILTPNLDRMATEGMKLTSFYAGSTVCAPSRCVLMTGKHTGRARVRGNARLPLQSEDVTVAEALKDAGYRTALCGKWGLGEEGTTGVPTRQGFDYFFGYLNQRHAHNYYPEFLYRGEERVPLRNKDADEWLDSGNRRTPGDGYASKKVDYSHDLVVEDALKWMRAAANSADPFFLYLALTIPHANNEATRGTGSGQEVPDLGLYKGKDWPEPDKGQAAMITRMDADVGRLLDLLSELGADEDTLVIFSSDNGPHKEGGNNPEFFDANGPLRGMKRSLQEGGIRVPTIARWPGKIPAGSVSDHPAYFGDFFATACDIAGAELPKSQNFQSISFLSTLVGTPAEQKSHDYLYWEFYEQGSRQAVRFGPWKAIREPMITGDIELYHLDDDLGEDRNVAADHPDIVAKAAAFMDEAHVPDPNWPVPGNG